MNEELHPESPLPNGADLGPVPVMGADPVKKPKRKRRKKVVAKVARAPKTKPIDPLKAEAEALQAGALNPHFAMSASPVEEAPTPTLLTGVGAAHLEEARERRHKQMFVDARSTTAPPIKSTWRQRFVFGLRRMTGTDRVDREPVRLSTTLTVLLCFALVGALAGVARAVL